MAARPVPETHNPTPMALYRRLHERYGELDWWPAKGPFQVMVGAVLTQRTAWRNVELAIRRLEDSGIDDIDTLLAIPIDELEDIIRPSGTYRQKARRLRDLFTMVKTSPHGTLESFLDRPGYRLREDLLSVRGIGPETADSMVLYAAHRPAFVVDAYTRRILARVGISTGQAYDDVAAWFLGGLPDDVALFNNYHAALVELAKEHCRKRPVCRGCPLVDMCRTGSGASVIHEG